MESMEKEIIDLYKVRLIEIINNYDEKLQSIDDEKMYQDILQEKTMILFCLQELTKYERVVYNKERSY